MSNKPIFVATHPRACSTAFERVFLTCRDTLECVHEPFGDAWYFGPERLSDRFEKDERARVESGFSGTTYKDVFTEIEAKNSEGKRLFIKDMAQYWIPPPGQPASVAPSLVDYRRGVGTEVKGPAKAVANGNGPTSPPYPYSTVAEPGNPTVIPDAMLKKYHFTFLIRHPRSSVPSYYRCTVPPLSDLTGFHYFDPIEAGYAELRALFDYLVSKGHIGPKLAGKGDRTYHPTNGTNGTNDTNGISGANGETNGHAEHDQIDICVIDADDLLDDPYAVIEEYCKTTGMNYSPDMLKWEDDESQQAAKAVFEKWRGFHEDALGSKEFRPRTQKKIPKPDDEMYAEWTEKYGEDAAKVMRKVVEDNVANYEYLKQFALKV